MLRNAKSIIVMATNYFVSSFLLRKLNSMCAITWRIHGLNIFARLYSLLDVME